MNVVRYRPAYMSGFPKEQATFETVEQLLAIPWIGEWSNLPNFHRFSVERDEGLVMAEFEGGQRWLCIGLLDTPLPHLPGIPEWVEPQNWRDKA